MAISQKFAPGSRVYYVTDKGTKCYGTVVPFDHPYVLRYDNRHSDNIQCVWAIWEGKYSGSDPGYVREGAVSLETPATPPTGHVHVYIANQTIQYSLEPVDGEIIAVVPYYEGYTLHELQQ